jgi:phosphate transport system substrate-binding protein
MKLLPLLGRVACVFLFAVVINAMHAQVKVDQRLPDYKAAAGVAGPLTWVGSDTMKEQLTLLAKGFLKFHPVVQPTIDVKGSAFGPPALLAGTAQFAAMSRGMKAAEIADFRKKFGYPPTALPVSIDMVVLLVHKENPIKGLTLPQVDAIFSRTRKGGLDRAVNTWGDVGLTGEWAAQPIRAHGRIPESGTHQFFREHALFNGAFRDEVKVQPDSASLVETISKDKYAIGYSGIGYKTGQVRAVPLALDIKSEYFPAEPDRATSGDYPLARLLLLYVDHKQGTELDPLRREFIRYLYSQQAQAEVIRSGFLPINSALAAQSLSSVGIQR